MCSKWIQIQKRGTLFVVFCFRNVQKDLQGIWSRIEVCVGFYSHVSMCKQSNMKLVGIKKDHSECDAISISAFFQYFEECIGRVFHLF